MTICIAAIAAEDSGIVLATDHMITIQVSDPYHRGTVPFQYEASYVPKSYDLGQCLNVLTAGDGVAAAEIVSEVKRLITEDHLTDFSVIVDLLRNVYQIHRRTFVEQRVLEPRGLSIAEFTAMQATMHPNVVSDIDTALRDYDLCLEMLVTGFDGGRPRISVVRNPGVVEEGDLAGFACLGTGAMFASIYMSESYSPKLSLPDLEQIVREAKSKAEAAPGVGPTTMVARIAKERCGDRAR